MKQQEYAVQGGFFSAIDIIWVCQTFMLNATRYVFAIQYIIIFSKTMITVQKVFIIRMTTLTYAFVKKTNTRRYDSLDYRLNQI